mgnify:FL=1
MKDFNEMTYDELIKVRKNNNLRTGILSGSSALLMFLTINPLYLLSIVCFIASNNLSKSALSGEIAKKDEDIKLINTICDEIINNIVKFANTLEVKNPLDAFYFFCEMYNNGYLSYDLNNKHFMKFPYYKDFELRSALTLNGHGVCRHISTFLKEFYKKLGYESDVVYGFMKEINADDFRRINELPANDKDVAKTIAKTISNLKDIKLNLLFSKFRYLNHAVTRVNFDDMTLLTDASNSMMLFPKLKDVFYSSPSFKLLFILDEDAKKKEIEEKYEYNYEKLLFQILESALKYKREKDLFKNFHKDNLDMLEEAESLTQKVLEKKY